MGYKFRQFEIPDRMMPALEGWTLRGEPIGDFLHAVLTNNLRGACERADDENIVNLPAYIAYLYNEAPSPCWGSPDKVRAWADKHFEGAAS